MGRYFGKVGYAISQEKIVNNIHTGIFEDSITEISYYGDVTNNTSRWISKDGALDDKKLTVTISIMADEFAYQNFSRIKYIEFMGVKWKVESIVPQRPRLILYLGGEYNGPEN